MKPSKQALSSWSHYGGGSNMRQNQAGCSGILLQLCPYVYTFYCLSSTNMSLLTLSCSPFPAACYTERHIFWLSQY